MMQTGVLLAGHGGQGVMFAGELLAKSGITRNLEVAFLPSYGPEMRGGTANCTVMLAEGELDCPLPDHPPAAIVLNAMSYERFQDAVAPNGLMIVNTSLVSERKWREDLKVIALPLNDLAVKLGSERVLNLIALGAYLGATKLLTLDDVMTTMEGLVSERHKHLLPLNRDALKIGFDAAEKEKA